MAEKKIITSFVIPKHAIEDMIYQYAYERKERMAERGELGGVSPCWAENQYAGLDGIQDVTVTLLDEKSGEDPVPFPLCAKCEKVIVVGYDADRARNDDPPPICECQNPVPQ